MKGIAIFYVYVFILAVLIVLAPNDRFALIGVTVYSIISTALLACFIESESNMFNEVLDSLTLTEQ